MYLFKGAEGEILIWMVLSHRFSQSTQKDGGRIQHSQKCNCKILPTVICDIIFATQSRRLEDRTGNQSIRLPTDRFDTTISTNSSAAAQPVHLAAPAEDLKSI